MPTAAEVSRRRACIDTVHVPAGVARRVRREALRSYPGEACGFLLGVVERRRAVVRRLRPEINRATRDDRYRIDPVDVFAAMREVRSTGEEIVGVYHSHPDGAAEPSATDRRDAWGEWLYAIVACRDGVAGELTCWRRDGDALLAVQVEEGEAGEAGAAEVALRPPGNPTSAARRESS